MSSWLDRRIAALDAVTEEASEKQSHFVSLLGLARKRVKPANLAREAGNKLLDLGLDALDRSKTSVRAHPFKAAGIAVATGTFLARKPLLRLLCAAYESFTRSRAVGKDEDIATADEKPHVEGE